MLMRDSNSSPMSEKASSQRLSGEGVSVLIVNWNTKDAVTRLLEDVLGDLGKYCRHVEVVVVDNHSADGSVAALAETFPAATYPQLKVIAETRNHGFAGGVNRGAQACSQPLILLLNSDVRTDAESIEAVAAYADQHPEAGVLGPKILNPDGSHQTSCWRDPSLFWPLMSAVFLDKVAALNFERYGEKPFAEPLDVDCVCGCALLVRRDLFLQLQGLDEDYFMYFEETDLCVRIRGLGRTVRFVPVGRFLHEDGGTSKQVKLRTYLDFRRSQMLFHRKHHGALSALTVRALLALSALLRVPVLCLLSLRGGSRGGDAKSRLSLTVRGLCWLLNPFGGLIPQVQREG